MLLDRGDLFAGCTIERELGAGGMSRVYLVRNDAPPRLEALKLLHGPIQADPSFVARFEREMQLLLKLEHPNIVPLYASGIERGIPWIRLRYVEGGELARRMNGGLTPREGIALLRGVASALAFAHAAGVVHRDLKPQNILLGGQDAAYLSDFGIAAVMNGGTRLTETGTVSPGTLPYMAPEQFRGKPATPATDVYALAWICFRMLAGAEPFDPEVREAWIHFHLDMPPPFDMLGHHPWAVVEVLQHALAKDPARRLADPRALIDRLAHALDASTRSSGSIERPTQRASSVPHANATAPAAASTADVRQERAVRPHEPQHPPQSPMMQRSVERRTHATLMGLAVLILAGGGTLQWALPDPTDPQVVATSAEHLPVSFTVDPPNVAATIEVVGFGTYQPPSIRLPAGKHVVNVRAAGFPLRTEVIDVAAGRLMHTLTLGTAQERFALTVTPVPADAAIRIMNIRERYRPGIELRPGDYRIEVSRSGYRTALQTITLGRAPNHTQIVLQPDAPGAAGPLEVERRATGPELTPLSRQDVIDSDYAGCGLSPTRYSVMQLGTPPRYLLWAYGHPSPTLWLRLDGTLHKLPMQQTQRSRPDYQPRQKGDQILYSLSGSAISGKLLVTYNGLGCPPEQEICEVYLFQGRLQLDTANGPLDLELFGECGL